MRDLQIAGAEYTAFFYGFSFGFESGGRRRVLSPCREGVWRAVLLSHFIENPLSIPEGCWVSEAHTGRGESGAQSLGSTGCKDQLQPAEGASHLQTELGAVL